MKYLSFALELAAIAYTAYGLNWAYLFICKPFWTVEVLTEENPNCSVISLKPRYRLLQIILSPIWPVGFLIEATCHISEKAMRLAYVCKNF